ncbi:hypothetical protein CPB85DRAFT_166967 [Mucidula mucida]|nr:hypothetical protein CPB85DRAFT_166967 [Mucidula mucida]
MPIQAPAPKPSFSKFFMKNWFAVEALPIVVIVGVVVTMGTYATWHAARSPTVVWTKANPTPWNNIQPDEGTKLIEVNHKFDKKWVRDRF